VGEGARGEGEGWPYSNPSAIGNGVPNLELVKFSV